MSFLTIVPQISTAQEAGAWRIPINSVFQSGPCIITAVGSVDLDCVSDDLDGDCSVSGSITFTWSGENCMFDGMKFNVIFRGTKRTGYYGTDQQSQSYLMNYPEVYEILDDLIDEIMLNR